MKQPCERNSPPDTQVSVGGAGGAPGSRADSPAAPDPDPALQLCPCSPGDPWREKIDLEYLEDSMLEQGKTLIIFSLPCPAEEEIERVAFVGTYHTARVIPPHNT